MNSRFVNLTNYCVLEYRSVPLGDPNPDLMSLQYYFLENNNVGTVQIFTTDAYLDSTHNSRDLSVVAVGGGKLVSDDITKLPIYTDYDPNISLSQLSPSLSVNQVVDTMRFHFASGFNFTEVENVIVGARHKLNDLSQIQLANVLLDASTAQSIFTYNNRPLFLANTIYDRYIDVKIPSVPWLDEDYDQFGSASFEHAISKGQGFIKKAPITVFLIEAAYEEYNAPNNVTYSRYQANAYYEGSVPQINIFDNLGCYIDEAADGDYIQFFATWNGAFPDALISTLNGSTADQNWIIVHQLNVYEQVGSEQVPSGNITIYQEDRFDLPLSYRPILREAGFAVSMSIDYTMRLLNKYSGEQIIKTASKTVINPNKYGKTLAKINLPEGPQSMKVYNKIVQKNFEAGKLFAPKSTHVKAAKTALETAVKTKTVTVKVPEYIPIKQASVKLSQKNALHKAGNESDHVIYGQGRLTLPVDPSDNLLVFTVYQANPLNSKQNIRVDLNSNSEFKLNFGKNSEFVFDSIIDTKLANPTRGEIAFRIPKINAKSLLETTDTQFFITVVSKTEGTETLLYTGNWIASANYAEVIAAEEDAATAAQNEDIISSLREQVATLTAQNEELQNQVRGSQVKNIVQLESPITISAPAAVSPPAD